MPREKARKRNLSKAPRYKLEAGTNKVPACRTHIIMFIESGAFSCLLKWNERLKC